MRPSPCHESGPDTPATAGWAGRAAQIVQLASDAIVVLDSQHRILAFNPAAERMFGVPEREVLGHAFTRFAAPGSDIAAVLTTSGETNGVTRGSPALPTFKGLHADGRELPCEASIAQREAEDGHELTLVIRDVTQPEQVEELLRQRIEFESFLFDLSRTFIGLPDETVDVHMAQGLARVGKFLRMDRITLLEWSPGTGEMIVVHSWNSPGVVAPTARITEPMQRWWVRQVLSGKVSLAPTVDDLPEEAAAEREYLRVRGVASAASIPLEVSGEISGAISFVTVHRHEQWAPETVSQLRAIGDILWNALKRRQAMQRLLAAQALVRESEERFRGIASTAPVLIWISDDHKTTYINDGWTRLTGQSAEAALGRGWTECIHPDDLERTLTVRRNASSQRAPFQMEFRVRRPSGEYRWLFAQGVPQIDADGGLARYIGSAIDVTERKEAEELRSTLSQRLIEGQELERSRLARELHDDVMQRMTVLVLNLETVRRRLDDAAPDAGQDIADAIRAATAITIDLQALAHRLHSFQLQRMGLEMAVHDLCQESSARSGLDIKSRSNGDLALVPQEVAVCLYRVLQEALQNAIKHSGSNDILVGLQAETGEVTLTVEDSGVGIDPARASLARGLGFVSMRERLKLVDGELTIAPHDPRGTTLRARIPLSRTAPAGARLPG